VIDVLPSLTGCSEYVVSRQPTRSQILFDRLSTAVQLTEQIQWVSPDVADGSECRFIALTQELFVASSQWRESEIPPLQGMRLAVRGKGQSPTRSCKRRVAGDLTLPRGLPRWSSATRRSRDAANVLRLAVAAEKPRTDTYDEFDELRTRAPLRVSDSGQRGTRHREAILRCVLMILKGLATGGARRTAASVQKTIRSVRRPSSGSRRFPPDQSGRQRGLRHAPVLGAPPSALGRSVAAFTGIRPDESVLQRGGKFCPKYP